MAKHPISSKKLCGANSVLLRCAWLLDVWATTTTTTAYYYYFEGALHGSQTYEQRLAVTHSCISRLEVEELDACVFMASKSMMATPSSGSEVTKAKPRSIESS